MTAKDLINVIVKTGCVKSDTFNQHYHVDWTKANTELLMMFRLGLDTELKVDE